MLQLLLEPLGVQELPEIYGWTGAVLGLTLFSYLYLLFSIRSGLQGIDPAVEEAARSLGYGRSSTFLRIILPQLRPSLIAGELLVMLNALQDFGTTSLMQFNTFTRVIFLQYRYGFERNQAAALALMLVVLVLLILWLEYKVRSQAAYYSRSATFHRPQALLCLGVWKVPALLFCLAVTSLGLVLPPIGFNTLATHIWIATENSLRMSLSIGCFCNLSPNTLSLN